jgi:DNA anti-recombination protein RmuC
MRKNTYNILAFVVALCISNTFSNAQNKASWYFDEASKIHIGGKTDQAIKLLEEGVGHWPYNPLIRDLLEELKKQKKDKSDQNQNQQQQQQQQQNKQQQQQQQMAQQQKQMSQKDAERILEALKNDEKNTQKKVRTKAPARVNVEKDW